MSVSSIRMSGIHNVKNALKRSMQIARQQLRHLHSKIAARRLVRKYGWYLPPANSRWKTQRIGEFQFMPTIEGWSDPNRLFVSGTELFRFVPDRSDNPRWRMTGDFIKSELFKALVQDGLLPDHRPVDLKIAGMPPGQVYKVERISPFNYCFEFNSAQLIDAATCCCNIALFLNRSNSPFRLTDSDLMNVTFDYTRPVFVDIGSFSHTFEFHGLLLFDAIELGLRRENRFEDATLSSLFTGLNARTTEDIHEGKRRLHQLEVSGTETEWDQYVDLCNDARRILPNSVEEIRPSSDEQMRICEWLNGIGGGIQSIIDIGGNDGEFARLFAKAGKDVISVDLSDRASSRGFRNAQRLGLRILFLVFSVKDRTSFSTPFWAYQEEYLNSRYIDLDWRQRLASDMAFCSSITHHLFRHGMSFDAQAELWEKIARRYLMIEFVSPEDAHIQSWKLPQSYSRQGFLKSIERHWRIEDSFEMGTRIWYLFQRV